MGVDFTINGSLDLVAVYAAVLSTIILIWEIVKWKSRNSVDVNCCMNMILIPRGNDEKYIRVEAVNKGQTKTVIKSVGFYYWDKCHHRFSKKKWKNFIARQDELPLVLEPGEMWSGLITQDSDLEKMAKNGYLYVVLNHSMSSKGVMKHVNFIEPVRNSK